MKINRKDVYDKMNGHCAYCGCEIAIKEMQVDHIIPQSSFFEDVIKKKVKIPDFLSHLTEFDVNHIDNLLPSCRVCNKWKNSFSLEFFRSQIAEQVKRLNDYSSNYRMAKKYGLIAETIKPIKFYFESLNTD